MKSVEVIIEHSKVERVVWEFYLENEYHLWLESYRLELRETPRHKFKAKYSYYRLDSRNSTLQENQIVLSEQLKETAKLKLLSQIKVQKWSERQ